MPPRPTRLSVQLLEDRLTPTVLPAGFSETVLAVGLNGPTALEVTPDGRLLVLEQAGVVRVIDADGLRPAPALTLAVDSTYERGLNGIVLDPEFTTNGYVYLYYTVRGTPTSPTFNRISRFVMAGDVIDPASETGLVDLDPVDYAPAHNGGAMHFGPDGKLYVGTGDNTFPANGQGLNTRLGKILRYNPDGSIPADNPTTFDGLAGTTEGANRAIWAVGFRNPFTFAVQPGTGVLFVNDVGQDRVEEVDAVQAGRNYGWPLTEGDFDPAAYPDFTRPLFSYPHGFGDAAGYAVTGGVFYTPPADGGFPAGFAGSYLFADYVNGWVRKYDPATGQAELFATGLTHSAALDLDVTPAGDLVILSRGTFAIGVDGLGTVVRVSYSDQPAIAVQPADVRAFEGDPATFAVVPSGVGPFAFQWLRDGVDIPGATVAEYTLPAAPLATTGARIQVVVQNPNGAVISRAAVLTVTNDRPPRPEIVAPAVGGTFAAGRAVAFAGAATDPEDGQLPAAALSWEFQYLTGAAAPRPLATARGVAAGTFDIPAVSPYMAPDVRVRVILMATDSVGNRTSVARDLLPELGTVALDSAPAGVPLTLDGQPAPASFVGVVGLQRVLAAPPTSVVGGQTYRFVGWADGVTAAARTIVAPPGGADFRAVYELVPAVPPTVVDPPAAPRPTPRVAVVGGTGPAVVVLTDPLSGTVVARIDVSARFPAGGVRVAVGDVTGDGVPDLVVGAGPGGPPTVAVYDGITGAELAAAEVFEGTFTGGVFVTVGDVDGDGQAEVIVSPDRGGGPRVRVLGGDLRRVVADFFGIADTAFRGGARVAADDLNGDGAADLVVAAGSGGGPRVAGYDGRALTAGQVVRLFADFFAFEPELRDGTFVAAGDLDGDGRADLVIGAGPGGGPRVLALDGPGLVDGRRTVLADFFAGDPAGRGGVRVVARDLDGDGRAELVAGSAPGSPPRVRVYRAAGGEPAGTLALPDDFTGGVFVG